MSWPTSDRNQADDRPNLRGPEPWPFTLPKSEHRNLLTEFSKRFRAVDRLVKRSLQQDERLKRAQQAAEDADNDLLDAIKECRTLWVRARWAHGQSTAAPTDAPPANGNDDQRNAANPPTKRRRRARALKDEVQSVEDTPRSR